MDEDYNECLKSHKSFGWEDRPPEVLQMGRRELKCDICRCHWDYHRRVVRYATEVVYTECHKIHRDGSGGVGYKDGCKEFVPGIGSSCAACGCHKSFHRNEITKEVA